jgi:hypothetical protein
VIGPVLGWAFNAFAYDECYSIDKTECMNERMEALEKQLEIEKRFRHQLQDYEYDRNLSRDRDYYPPFEFNPNLPGLPSDCIRHGDCR